MFDVRAYLLGLGLLLIAAALAWLASIAKRDVSIVDSLWGLMVALAAVSYAWPLDDVAPRGVLVLGLVVAWAVRLTTYITARNHGQGEDYRYREIRRRNEPLFVLKSLYLVFGLQAVLASMVSLPLLAAQRSDAALGLLDALGVAVVIGGLFVESIADWQLARFRRDPNNHGAVLDRGLWRYSRHPNYFGECCVWWGFGFLGLAAGGWWSMLSSLLITWLLLRVSGVSLLEQSIGHRRPAYADYVRRTSAFVPLPRRAAESRSGSALR